MARHTLTDYFYWRDGEKREWDIWLVDLWASRSPNIPELIFLSAEERLAIPQFSNYNPAAYIIQETCENSGLGSYYSSGQVKGTFLIPPDPDITLEGTKHLDYIYNHAIAQGYKDNANRKGIYLLSHEIQGTWQGVAATVLIPDKPQRECWDEVQWRTMIALEEILGQTQSHYPWNRCIWWHWPHEISYASRVDNPMWCNSHTKIMKALAWQTTKCNVCKRYVTAQIYPIKTAVGTNGNDPLWQPTVELGGSSEGYWIKCPYCPTTWEEETSVILYEDTSTSEVPIKIEYATHYCPNCHSFQPTMALEDNGNEDKVVLYPWGVDVYLSQYTLLGVSVAELTAGGIGVSEMLLAYKVANRIVPLIENAYLTANRINFPGVTDWLSIGRPNPLENPYEYFKLAQEQLNNAKAAQLVVTICVGLAVAGVLLSIFYKQGIVLSFGLQGQLPPKPRIGIRGQRSGYGVPICLNCVETLPWDKEFSEGKDLTSPYVNMNYGTGGCWMPDYIKPLPDFNDFESDFPDTQYPIVRF